MAVLRHTHDSVDAATDHSRSPVHTGLYPRQIVGTVDVRWAKDDGESRHGCGRGTIVKNIVEKHDGQLHYQHSVDSVDAATTQSRWGEQAGLWTRHNRQDYRGETYDGQLR